MLAVVHSGQLDDDEAAHGDEVVVVVDSRRMAVAHLHPKDSHLSMTMKCVALATDDDIPSPAACIHSYHQTNKATPSPVDPLWAEA